MAKQIVKMLFENVELKSINPFINKEGAINEDILVVTFENPKTKSQVETRFFKKNWEEAVIFNNGTPERYKAKDMSDDQKAKAKKYTLVGKTTKEYITQKDFCEDLKKAIGHRINVIGLATYSVNDNGYLQVNFDIQKIVLLSKEETAKSGSTLLIQTNILMKTSEFKNIRANTPFEAYIGIKTGEWYPVKAVVNWERFLGGMVSDIDFCNIVLDSIISEKKDMIEKGEYIEIPAGLELEMGRGERKPTEADLPLGYSLIIKNLADGDTEKYNKLIQKKLDEMPMITEEKGAFQMSYMFTANNTGKLVEAPKIFDKENGNSVTSAVAVQDILNKAKEKQAQQNKTETVETQKEETKTENSNVENTVETDDFPF